MIRAIGFGLLALLSCAQSPRSQGPLNVNLGGGYWFVADGYGSDIIHVTDEAFPEEGIQVVPPTVLQYAWNDAHIAAICSNKSAVRQYWVVDKTQLFDLGKITMDTLADGQVVNRKGPIVGPIDSLSFYAIIEAHRLQLVSALR